MAKRFITAEDLYRFQVPSGTAISPDGKQVILTLQRVDKKTEKKFSNLWLVPVENGQPRQFTYGDQNDTHPVWSPDGSQIAFLSNRQNKDKPPALYLIPLGGGEAHLLAQLDGEIGEIIWAPDGKKILCTVRKIDKEVLERQKNPDLKDLSAPARHYNRLFYKLDGYGYLPHERWHLWLIDSSSGKATQLTDHPIWDENYPDWSPDGKWIAFISNHSDDPDSNPDLDDIFLMPARGGETRRLEAPPGNKFSLRFSPDGKWLAYYGQEGIGQGFKNIGLWVIPTDGSQPARNLTEALDLNVSAWTINDIGGAVTNPPLWSADSQALYFPVTVHGSSILMKIQRDGTGLETILGEGGVFHTHTINQAANRIAGLYGTFSDPGQVMIIDLVSKQQHILTRFNRELLDKIDLGEIEEVWFKGPDNNDLQGWILKPPQFDPNKKYPSIMEIHGGPLTQYGKLFMHEFYYLAAQGFVVYFCNPRGGRGYGEQHAAAIHGNWGDRDFADLMAWADYMTQKTYIDTSKMGVTGGSYGGYMTVWIIGHTDRFRAAVTQRCVSNFISMWGSSDFNWVFQRELNDKPPFEALEYYWQRSPIAHIGNAKTPTLVIHNEMDLRCPIEQGEQVYVALKRLGVDTEMVRFPEEFHGLSRGGRTDRRILRLNHIARWFKKYLSDDKQLH